MARFTDAQLGLLIQKAARRVNRDLCLTGTTDEILTDASGTFPTLDADLEDLVLMQAECLISQRDFNSDLSSGAVGVRVVDGEQETDTRNRATARGTFFNSPYGPCAIYADAINIEKVKRKLHGRLVW